MQLPSLAPESSEDASKPIVPAAAPDQARPDLGEILKPYEATAQLASKGQEIGSGILDQTNKIQSAFATSNYINDMTAYARSTAAQTITNPEAAAAAWKQQSDATINKYAPTIGGAFARQDFTASSPVALKYLQNEFLAGADARNKETVVANGLLADQNDAKNYVQTNDPTARQAIIDARNARWNGLQETNFINPEQKITNDQRWAKETATDWVNNQPPDKKLQLLSSASQPTSAVSDIITQAATKNGADPDVLAKTAVLESGGNTHAQNGSSSGLMQLQPSTAKQYGVTNPLDGAASADAGAKLQNDNSKALTSSLGRAPSGDELYLAHQQGASGATALIKNPDANAVDALAPAYGGDRTKAQAAITGNGGTTNMTAGQFTSMWQQKYDNADTSALSGKQAFPATGTPVDMLSPTERTQMLRQTQAEINIDANRQEKVVKQQQEGVMNNYLETAWKAKTGNQPIQLDQVAQDKTLTFEQKERVLTALQGMATKEEKTDPAVFNDTFHRIVDPSSANPITSAQDLIPMVGHGISYEDYQKLNKELPNDKYPQTTEAISKTMRDITAANGNVDGQGSQRAMQWYQQASAMRNSNKDLDDGALSKALPTPVIPSRAQQIQNAAKLTTARTASDDTTIRVTNSEGKPGRIPKSQLKDALNLGYKQVQ